MSGRPCHSPDEARSAAGLLEVADPLLGHASSLGRAGLGRLRLVNRSMLSKVDDANRLPLVVPASRLPDVAQGGRLLRSVEHIRILSDAIARKRGSARTSCDRAAAEWIATLDACPPMVRNDVFLDAIAHRRMPWDLDNYTAAEEDGDDWSPLRPQVVRLSVLPPPRLRCLVSLVVHGGSTELVVFDLDVVLRNCTALRSLDVRHCRLRGLGASSAAPAPALSDVQRLPLEELLLCECHCNPHVSVLRWLPLASVVEPDQPDQLGQLGQLCGPTLRTLVLAYCSTTESLSFLRGCSALRSLTLIDTDACHGLLQELQAETVVNLPTSLQVLDVGLYGDVDFAALAWLRRSLPELRSLGISDASLRGTATLAVVSDGIRELALKACRLPHLHAILPPGSDAFRALSRLVLRGPIGEMPIGDAFVSAAPTLEVLDLHGCGNEIYLRVTLAAAQRLRELSISMCSGIVLGAPAPSRPLRVLRLVDCKDVRGIADLTSGCNALVEARICGCDTPAGHTAPSDALLAAMAPDRGSSASIETAELERDPLLTSLDALAPLPLVAAVAPGGASHLLRLKELYLRKCPNVADVPPLTHMAALRRLQISGCVRLTALRALPPGLTWLNLDKCDRLSDISAVAECSVLVTLSLADCHTLSDVGALASCTALVSLNLRNCFGLASVEPLARCASLKLLTLSGAMALGSLAPLLQCEALGKIVLGCDKELWSLARLVRLEPLCRKI